MLTKTVTYLIAQLPNILSFSPPSFLISNCFTSLISNFSFLTSSLAGNGASHNARCGTEVRSEPQLDNNAGIASRDINAANYDQ